MFEVLVVLKEDKNDDGCLIKTSETDDKTLTYTVEAEKLIIVTVKNHGPEVWVTPYYHDENGKTEKLEPISFVNGGQHEMPFPLMKDRDEADDGWELKDADGETILHLVFNVGGTVVFEPEDGKVVIQAQVGNVQEGPMTMLEFEIPAPGQYSRGIKVFDPRIKKTQYLVKIIEVRTYRGDGTDFRFEYDDGSERDYGFQMFNGATKSLRKFLGAFITP